jgi:pilus assembly protein CpaB
MPIRVVFDDVLPLIHPGDFVDVICVYGDTKETSVLLQRVLVLAAGTETGTDRSPDKRMQRATILTLSVSLQEGQLLALAMEKGKLTVVVRNPDDQKIAETPPDLTPATLSDTQKRQAVQSVRRRGNGPVKLEVEPQPK